LKEPTGVRAAETITMSVIADSLQMDVEWLENIMTGGTAGSLCRAACGFSTIWRRGAA
jgi:hypothetical protein